MGSVFTKCCCGKGSQDVNRQPEIETTVEIYKQKFNSVEICFNLIQISDSQFRFKKTYKNYRRNIVNLVKAEKQLYNKRMPNRSSCLPKIIEERYLNDSLSFECYDKCLLYILLKEENSFLDIIRKNLEKIIKNMIEDLHLLSNVEIFHLNINPKNLFFNQNGQILLQNFRFPEVYKLFQDDDKDIYNNKFHLGNNRINWEAPEINNSECEIDHEKIDIFAIGKFIECIKPDPSSILFRLYECMIQTEPSKRPSYKKCIHFLENQGALPHYTLLQPDLPPMRQVKSTKIYDYKKVSSQYFLRNFKVQEITVKIPSYIPTIRNYIKNMKYLSDTSEKNGCFLKVFSILEETNQFTLITEHCTNNMEKKVFNMEKNYSNSDLWDIVTPLFYVVDTYSKHGIFHGNLCLKNLKINDENYLKISGFLFYGKDLIDDFEVVEELQRKNNLAPEILKAAEEVKDGRDKLEDIDFGKADVYSLGITLIEIATKTSRREMNIENDRRMKKIIDKQENINDEMKETLKKMIEREPQKRYDITSCVKFLPVESREKSYLSIQVNK